jgi:glycosyltransferase 2 family protein
MLRRLVQWLQPVVLILSMLAIGWFLTNQWPTLRNYPWRLDWRWLLATCVVTLASWGVEIAIWRHLLVSLGGHLSFWTAARLWFLSAIVRYIPGNIWQPLTLTLYSRRHGVPPETTITSIVLFQVVILLAVIPIFVGYFLWIDTTSFAAQYVAHVPQAFLWLALAPLLLFLLRPQWLIQLLNWGLARLQRPPLATQLTSGRLLMLILASLFVWLLWGGVFVCITFAVAGDGVADRAAITPLLIASFPIANTIGLLSLITPSGFGVREGTFFLLLTPQIDGGVVTVIALALRVWGVLNELLLALISLPFEQASIASQGNEPTVPFDSAIAEPVVASDLRREIT